MISVFDYERLKQAIEESGKTRTYLCGKLGRPAYYLRDVIRQRNAIPEDYQLILAEELDVTVEWLRGETDEKKPATVSGSGSGSRDKLLELLPNISDEHAVQLALWLIEHKVAEQYLPDIAAKAISRMQKANDKTE